MKEGKRIINNFGRFITSLSAFKDGGDSKSLLNSSHYIPLSCSEFLPSFLQLHVVDLLDGLHCTFPNTRFTFKTTEKWDYIIDLTFVIKYKTHSQCTRDSFPGGKAAGA
jgi:hypothetical protein